MQIIMRSLFTMLSSLEHSQHHKDKVTTNTLNNEQKEENLQWLNCTVAAKQRTQRRKRKSRAAICRLGASMQNLPRFFGA